ncbi:polysaccharide deacetylase family protein [Aestuariibacter sp. A3R04]|nr:polysaccharide deacetylase family protein [Aestuariibacter sp. A3R04]MBU3021757.1 polysaccharide deacetylase family protein [Aestuariibacter sp. A3R04]
MKVESLIGLDQRRWRQAPYGLYSVNLHRVGDYREASGDPNVYSCTPSQLDAHIRFFKQHFDIVSLDDVTQAIASPALLKNRRCMAITFDDGYADNYHHAFPILTSHQVPAAFFIATGLVGNNVLPWWDKVAFLLKNSALSTIKLTQWVNSVGYKGDIKQFIRLVLKEIKASGQCLDKQIEELESLTGLNSSYPSPEFVSWAQLKEMYKAGMTIGAHSHHHYILSSLTDDEILFELQHSKKLLEEHLGISINAFSYPVGNQSTYNNGVIEALKSSGYELAFNFRPGINASVEKKCYDLHRFPIEPTMTTDSFKKMVSYAPVY